MNICKFIDERPKGGGKSLLNIFIQSKCLLYPGVFQTGSKAEEMAIRAFLFILPFFINEETSEQVCSFADTGEMTLIGLNGI